jgi:hypothetical protein
VAIASLTSRRIVAGAAILALALVPSVVTGAVLSTSEDEHGAVAVLNLLALPIYLRDLVFLGHIDPDSPLGGVAGGAVLAVITYVAVLAIAFAILFRRYREPDA